MEGEGEVEFVPVCIYCRVSKAVFKLTIATLEGKEIDFSFLCWDCAKTAKVCRVLGVEWGKYKEGK